jgi:hypothetical protein
MVYGINVLEFRRLNQSMYFFEKNQVLFEIGGGRGSAKYSLRKTKKISKTFGNRRIFGMILRSLAMNNLLT